MKNRSTIWLFVVLVFALPFAAWLGLQWYNQKWQPLPVFAELKPTAPGGTALSGSLLLANQDGQFVSLGDGDGKIRVVNFFFTRCPSICPKMMNNLQKVRNQFETDSNVHLYSISVDPENDSVTQLGQYAKHFGLDLRYWDLLTGNKKEIYRLARNDFKVAATDGDGGAGDFIHSEKLILLDRHHRIRGYYSGVSSAEVDQLIHDIKKLKDENE